jgi:ribosomal-protein-alanine N-acetyltransferase
MPHGERMASVPAFVDTQRLRLRRPRASDAAAVFAYASDLEVTHYADWPRCMTEEAALAYLEASGSAWSSGEEYFWVVTLAGMDSAIGGASLRVRDHAADFGYVLGRAQWGKGLGTELSRAIVSIACDIPGIRRVWATCDAQNLASARVLEKSGLVREGVLRAYSVRPQISVEPRDALIYAMVRR